MLKSFISAAIFLKILFLSTETSGAVNDSTAIYDQPVLLTSAGQSADVLILKGLCMRAGIDFKYSSRATADSLGEYRTLLLVAGGSSKGLGAARIDAAAEAVRVKALEKAAQKSKIPIVTLHVGGDARRGALSDPFNRLAAEVSELVVVVSSGDKDGFFKKIAEKNEARYISVDKQIELVGVLKEMFGIKEAPPEESPE